VCSYFRYLFFVNVVVTFVLKKFPPKKNFFFSLSLETIVETFAAGRDEQHFKDSRWPFEIISVEFSKVCVLIFFMEHQIDLSSSNSFNSLHKQLIFVDLNSMIQNMPSKQH
jgi:hypothetical protein